MIGTANGGTSTQIERHLVYERPPRTTCPTIFLPVQNVSGTTPAIGQDSSRNANLVKFRQSGSARTSIRADQAFIFYDSFYSPGYMVNYGFGAILTAEMRQHISEAHGTFDTGDSRWYGWLSEHLLRYGSERDTRTLMQNFLGRPVSPQALLVQIHRLRPVTLEATGDHSTDSASHSTFPPPNYLPVGAMGGLE